jgi:hypothetical protein
MTAAQAPLVSRTKTGKPLPGWVAPAALLAGGSVLLLAVAVLAVVLFAGRPAGEKVAAAPTVAPAAATPPVRSTPEPGRGLLDVEKAFQAAEAAERDAGEEYEKARDAYRRFLNEHEACPVRYQKAARQKVDVELPARMDERDFRRAGESVAAASTDLDRARACWEAYLSCYPKGAHVEEVHRRLETCIDDGDFRRAADAAAAAGADPGRARACWEAYLTGHPKGAHVAEATRHLEACSTWQVAVTQATLTDTYREGTGDTGFTYQTSNPDSRVAVIHVEFKALSATGSSLEERLRPGHTILSEDAIDFLKDRGKILQQFGMTALDQDKRLSRPARLFLSSQVRLVLADRTSAQPAVTSEVGPFNHGCTAITDRTTLHIGTPNEDVPVLRFVRGPHITAALVQPGMKARVTLVFNVPAGTEKASLAFYDCRPVEVVFGR